MMSPTYLAWGSGMLDKRMGGKGENGNEVLARAKGALASLLSYCDNGHMAVCVTHSAFLKFIVAAVGAPSGVRQPNCSINVLDWSPETERVVALVVAGQRASQLPTELVPRFGPKGLPRIVISASSVEATRSA